MVTINMWDPDELEWVVNHKLEDTNIVDWWIAGHEVAPTTGHRHVHIYLILARKLRINQVSDLFMSMRPHIDLCKGTHQQCRDYVTKDGNYYQSKH